MRITFNKGDAIISLDNEKSEIVPTNKQQMHISYNKSDAGQYIVIKCIPVSNIKTMQFIIGEENSGFIYDFPITF